MLWCSANPCDAASNVSQVWRSRCAVSNRRFGGHVILTLTRWDPILPPTPYNLVLMMQNEAQKLHEKGKEAFPAETVARIDERLRWAKKVCDESWETFDHTGGSQACPIRSVPKRQVADGRTADGMTSAGGPQSVVVGVCAAAVAFMLGYGANRYLNR